MESILKTINSLSASAALCIPFQYSDNFCKKILLVDLLSPSATVTGSSDNPVAGKC